MLFFYLKSVGEQQTGDFTAIDAGVYSTPDEAREDARADVEFRTVKTAYKLLGLPEGYRLTDEEISELRTAQATAVDSLVPSVDALFV